MDTLFYFQEPDPPVTGYGILFGFEVLHYRGQRLFTGGPDSTRKIRLKK